jgi:hypothetical protein
MGSQWISIYTSLGMQHALTLLAQNQPDPMSSSGRDVLQQLSQMAPAAEGLIAIGGAGPAIVVGGFGAGAACGASGACWVVGIGLGSYVTYDIFQYYIPSMEEQPANVPMDTGHTGEPPGGEEPPIQGPASPGSAPPPPPPAP